MGAFGILKANLFAFLKQREFEVALAEGHRYTVKLIELQGTEKILKAGLTRNEKRNLDDLMGLHLQEMEELMEIAFYRGLVRSGKPILSNAMDEVLVTVAKRIKQAREEGEVRRFD